MLPFVLDGVKIVAMGVKGRRRFTLDADPELAEAFQALTPGRQKSYMFNLNRPNNSDAVGAD